MAPKKYSFAKHSSSGFAHIAAKGAAWNMGLALANKGFTFVGQIILVWLLAPADMGLAGMAIATIGFANFFSAGGVGDVLIQRRRFEKEASQGLWISFGLCSAMAVLTVIFAFCTVLIKQKELFELILILALSNYVWFPNPLLEAKLKVHFNFRDLSIAYFLSGVSYTTLSIIFAWFGWGPYSLVLSRLLQNLIQVVYMYWREGGVPIKSPQPRLIKIILKPTILMAINGFFIGLQTQAPVFCVGILLNSTSTGHFAWGWAVASQAVYLLALNLRQVLLPIFSKISGNKERQITAVIKSARVITAALVLACGVQALLAEPILIRFFPDKWQPAGPVVTWISLGLCMQGVWVSVTAWLNANGRYRDLLWANAVPAFLAAVFSVIGASSGKVETVSMGAGAGIIIGALYSLSFLPIQSLKSTAKTFIGPLIISFLLLFLGLYFIEASQLGLKILVGFIYIVGGGLAWWYFDDGVIKKMVSQFLGNRPKLIGATI